MIAGRKKQGYNSRYRLGIHHCGSNSRPITQYPMACSPEQKVRIREINANTNHLPSFLIDKIKLAIPVTEISKSKKMNDQFH